MGINIAVKVAYIGLKYHGWQSQPNLVTVENELHNALIKSKFLNPTFMNQLKYGGRTDKGVNALGQVISFPLKAKSVPERFLHRINSYLPKSIRCWAYTLTNDNFHPRFDAQERIYHYVLHEPGLSDLDWNQVTKIVPILIGDHNFQNFAKHDPKKFVDTNRRLNSIKITEKMRDVFIIELSAPNFLWEQCRRISGHLLQLARKEVDNNYTKLLLSKPLENKPMPLPPQFLTLIEIKIPNLSYFKIDDEIIEILKKDLANVIINYKKQIYLNEHLFKYWIDKIK